MNITTSRLNSQAVLERLNGDEVLYHAILSKAREKLPLGVTSLKQKIKEQQWDDCCLLAHGLRGSLTGIGADIAACYVGELENCFKNNTMDFTSTLAALDKELEQVFAFLNTLD